MNPSKFKTNEDYFKVIDTEKKAYFLGLFAADGCNYIDGNRTRCFISLQEKDKDILEILNSEIFPTGDRKLIYKKQRKNVTPQYKFETFNKKISNDLIYHGIVPRKSLILKFPTTIPVNLINHFIRGYFDGDGYIGTEGKQGRPHKKFRIVILSTNSFLNSLMSFLPNNIRCSIYKRGNVYALSIRGNHQVKNFCEFIYKDGITFLQRKYGHYLNLIQTINDRNKKKSSKYKGISYAKHMKKWLAYFINGSKQIKVGWFKTENEAYNARNNFKLPNTCKNLEQTKFNLSYENLPQ